MSVGGIQQLLERQIEDWMEGYDSARSVYFFAREEAFVADYNLSLELLT